MDGKAGDRLVWSDVSWSAREIHLPQTLSEERSRDELSDWEQVSWLPAECIAHRQSRPPPASAMLPLGLAVEQKKM